MWAIGIICLVGGLLLGSLLGLAITFDWEAYFKYLEKKDEMRIRTAMEIIEKKGE